MSSLQWDGSKLFIIIKQANFTKIKQMYEETSSLQPFLENVLVKSQFLIVMFLVISRSHFMGHLNNNAGAKNN